MRPRAGQLMDLACNTLYVDNEENVALGLKLAIELHRNFRNILEPKAPVLMEFVKQVGWFSTERSSVKKYSLWCKTASIDRSSSCGLYIMFSMPTFLRRVLLGFLESIHTNRLQFIGGAHYYRS